MHGNGNDFIIIDNTNINVSFSSKRVIQLSDRNIGIGFDQLILLENSNKYDIFMKIYNNDGKEVEMCGNAARCVASLLFSANKNLGGGVLLELSHELDCIICLFGVPKKISAKLFFSKFLKINVETGVKAIFYYKKNFKINLNLDFHSKNCNLRYFKIMGKNEYINWNILKNSLIFKKKTEKKKFKTNNLMFRSQMAAFLKNKFGNFERQYDTSYKILKIIELIKKSHFKQKIINYD